MIWISIIPFVIFAKNMISTYIQGRKTLIGLQESLKISFPKMKPQKLLPMIKATR